jgi:glutamate/tyrosine decarboxylase-like PLP-dependent enzyme
MANTYHLQNELLKLESMRTNLQKSVLDVNEKAISQAEIEDRAELYKSHDAIIDFINAQTNVINLCIKHVENMHTKEYVKHLQDTINKQRFYIKNLGGNPSNISYIKCEDLC